MIRFFSSSYLTLPTSIIRESSLASIMANKEDGVSSNLANYLPAINSLQLAIVVASKTSLFEAVSLPYRIFSKMETFMRLGSYMTNEM